MKKTNTNLASQLALAAFLALGTLAVTSCNKDNNQTGQEIPTGKSQIIVRISGISNGENIPSKGTKSSTSSHASNQKSIELVQGNGFDAIVALDNKISVTGAQTSHGLKASNGIRAASEVTKGTTYSLYLYKKDGATYTFEKVVPYTVGQETAVELSNGSYKWVALSYNNTATLPDGTINNIDLPANTDVLYKASSEDLIIGGNEVPINITFDRVYSRIAVEVNTFGMFGPMKKTPTIAVSGTNFIKSGKLDLTTGALTASAAGTDLALTEADFVDFNPSNGTSYQKVAYFYTAPQAENIISVTVKDLSIQLEDGTTRAFGTNKLDQKLYITPEAGKNHRFLVGLAESALTRDDVQWSRSNLYYKAGDITPYRFNTTNDYNAVADPRAYFSFKGHLPMTLASNDPKKQKDPCALVYPAGLWKTPTAAQVNAVTSRSGLLGDLLGGVLDLVLPSKTKGTSENNKGLEYAGATGANPAYGDAQNTLRFNYNGSQSKISVLSDLVSLNLGNTKGKHAAFWSSNELIDLSLLGTGVGAQSFIGYKASGLLGSATIATTAAGLLNINLLGLDVISSELMNVRCVRDQSWVIKSLLPDYNPNPAL